MKVLELVDGMYGKGEAHRVLIVKEIAFLFSEAHKSKRKQQPWVCTG
jgi:hypothetical protein